MTLSPDSLTAGLAGLALGLVLGLILLRILAGRTSQGDTVRELEENLPLPFFEARLDGTIAYANDQALIQFGYTQEDFARGIDVFQVIIEQDRTRARENIRRILSGEQQGNEYTGLRKDGSTFPIVIHTTVIKKRGKPAGFRGLVMDLEPLRHAEEALRAGEQRFQALVQHARDITAILDSQRRIVYVSPAFERTLGYHTTEVMGLPVMTLVHPEDEAVVHQDLNALYLRSGNGIPTEFRLRHSEGQYVRMEALGTNLLDVPSIAGVVITARDVSERFETEHELRRLNRALRTLTACSQAVVRAVGELSLLREVCRTVIEMGGYRFAWVGYALSDHDRMIEPAAWAGFEDGYLSVLRLHWGTGPLNPGPIASAIRTRRPVVVNDLTQPQDTYPLPYLAEARRRGYAAILALPLFFDDQVYGALAIYSGQTGPFDYDEVDLLSDLAADLSYGIHTLRTREQNRQARRLLEKSNLDLVKAYEATLEGWSKALELRERETAGHSQRVVEMTLRLSRIVGIPEEQIEHVRRGALLHDIGKMGVPDSILLKPGPLTDEEVLVMRLHPEYARELIESIEFLRPALDIPYCHHENWDGSGYPRRLTGEEIPLAARVFAVVDVWDALRSDRPYSRPWPEEDVLNYLRENAGRLFDPRVTEAFLNILKNKVES